MQPNLPDKKQVIDALLSQASTVFVHLDPRRDQVVVPPQFRKQPMLVLEIGLNMRVPIPDLEIDEESIGCTLSFGGRPYWCRMPWTAIFALVTSEQRGMIWPPDVPAEVADRFVPPTSKPAAPKKPTGPKLVAAADDEDKVPRPLSAVDAPEPEAEGDAAAQDEQERSDEPTEDEPKRKLPSYLRVVK